MNKFEKLLAHFYFMLVFGLLCLNLFNLIKIALQILGGIVFVLTIIYIYNVLKRGMSNSSKSKIIVRYKMPPVHRE